MEDFRNVPPFMAPTSMDPVRHGSNPSAPNHDAPAAVFTHPQYPVSYPPHINPSLPTFANTPSAPADTDMQAISAFGPDRFNPRQTRCPALHMNSYHPHNAGHQAVFRPPYMPSRPYHSNFSDGHSPYSSQQYCPAVPFQPPNMVPPMGYDQPFSSMASVGSFDQGPHRLPNSMVPPTNPNVNLGNVAGSHPFSRMNRDSPRNYRSQHVHHNRTQSHEYLYQDSQPSWDSRERRAAVYSSNQARQTNQVTAPRTSTARRSYARFATDLSSSLDEDEAAARIAPNNRSRPRPRDSRPRYYEQIFDSRFTTTRQIAELKTNLPRRLPGDLPAETSRSCEICQKDYAINHVQPTEDEEIAIELPCGHVFGEFCIFEWFDTCKNYKNKVTCPMCRKQLIEPIQDHPALFNALARRNRAVHEMLAQEFGQGYLAHD